MRFASSRPLTIGPVFTSAVFVQPLYVPHAHIVFTFGILGFGWEVNKDNESEVAGKLLTCMHDDGIPWLQKTSDTD